MVFSEFFLLCASVSLWLAFGFSALSAAGAAYAALFGLVYGSAYLLLRRVWPLAIGHALYNIRLDLAS